MGLVNDFLGSVSILSTTIDEWMEQELREITDDRVTTSQLKVLKLVARTNARRIGDVADFLAVSNAAASKAVDRLVRRGLIRRTEAASDRSNKLQSLDGPDFTLPDITGKLHSLSDFRGRKVFLATWASW